MKQFYLYQLEHQVKNSDWSHALTPVDNIINKFSDYFNQIKEYYYNNPDKVKTFQSITREGRRDYVDTYGTTPELKSDLYRWVFDPIYENFLDQPGGTYCQMPGNTTDLLKSYFSKRFNLEHDTLAVGIHTQKPGQIFAMHIDSPKFKRFNLPFNSIFDDSPVERYICFFDDWKHGQAFQMGETMIKWKAGDVFYWNNRDVPHGSANFGYDDRFMLIVTGVNLNKI